MQDYNQNRKGRNLRKYIVQMKALITSGRLSIIENGVSTDGIGW